MTEPSSHGVTRPREVIRLLPVARLSMLLTYSAINTAMLRSRVMAQLFIGLLPLKLFLLVAVSSTSARSPVLNLLSLPSRTMVPLLAGAPMARQATLLASILPVLARLLALITHSLP